MKNFIRFIILVLILILLGLWSPWRSINIDVARLFNVETPDPIAGLRVYSLVGELEVYIDGELEGTTSAEDSFPLLVNDLDPGEKLVSIKRVSNIEGAFWSYDQILDFEQGIDIVISAGIGPEKEFSEISLISVTKKTNEDYNLKVNLNVDNTTIDLNGVVNKITGNTFTSTIYLDSVSEIKIAKPGLETLEFKILPDSQEERDKFQDFIINVDVQLMYQPVKVE